MRSQILFVKAIESLKRDIHYRLYHLTVAFIFVKCALLILQLTFCTNQSTSPPSLKSICTSANSLWFSSIWLTQSRHFVAHCFVLAYHFLNKASLLANPIVTKLDFVTIFFFNSLFSFDFYTPYNQILFVLDLSTPVHLLTITFI